MAEVDGNRTRRTGITHPTRFEGGGAHQALGHLHRRPYRRPLRCTSPAPGERGGTVVRCSCDSRLGDQTPSPALVSVPTMSKNRILLIAVLVALLAVLSRKVRDV